MVNYALMPSGWLQGPLVKDYLRAVVPGLPAGRLATTSVARPSAQSWACVYRYLVAGRRTVPLPTNTPVIRVWTRP